MALTYFSQYPDANKKFDAIVNAFKNKIPYTRNKFTLDAVRKLHSLHGGDSVAVKNRRISLENAIKANLQNPDDIWKAGLLIHAYADAYAHTDGDLNSTNEKAYSQTFGHALHSLTGRDPDQVINQRNRKKYLEYSDNLFELLKTPDANPKKYEAFKTLVVNSSCKKDKCLKKSLINKTDAFKINKFTSCMNSNMKPLTTEQVQSVMDQIK